MGFVVAVSFFCCLVLVPAVKRLAWKLDAVSRPDGQRRTHARPTPVLGGVAISVGVLAGTLVAMVIIPELVNDTRWLVGLGATCTLLCLLGAYDDCHDIRARTKLAGQIFSIIPLLLAGCYAEEVILFGNSISLGYLAIPCSIAWFILIINAVNLIDGMDGLASVTGIAVAIGVAGITFTQGRPEIVAVALTLASALTAFLLYNRPPAKIYLGDCGSMVIGGILAALTLRLTWQPQVANVTVVAILLFVPLADTALAILRRTMNGSGVMAADRGHVHHRLLDRGFGIHRILAFLALLSMMCGSVAWAVSVSGGEWLAWGIIAGSMVLGVRYRLLGHQEWAILVSRLSLPSQPARDVPAPIPTLPVSETAEDESVTTYRDAA